MIKVDIVNIDRRELVERVSYRKHGIYIHGLDTSDRTLEVFIEVKSDDKNYEEILINRNYFTLPIAYGMVSFVGRVEIDGKKLPSIFIGIKSYNGITEINDTSDIISMAKSIINQDLCA